MPLLDLPNELLLRIAWFVLKCPTCHCHHFSRHLSALARSNQHLHAILVPELLRTASTLHILLWAITHSRADTATLALTHGASPNVLLRQTHHHEHSTANIRLGTPVEIAMRMCIRSADQPSLATLMSLLHAGGNPTIEPLSILADAGDLPVLARCLPRITAIDQRDSQTGYTLLEAAGAAGHVSIVKLLLSAGANVNSSGPRDSPNYYPPLWTIGDAPLPVLQVLLDAGADATWEHEGVSLVERVLQTYRSWQDVDGNVDLLARHGARMPEGEEAIALWQAPVWESWTGGESSEVVERATEQIVG